MINSINFIDGLDGLSSGIALIAAVTLGLISLTRRRSASRSSRSCASRSPARCSGSCAGTSTRRSIFVGTSGVMFLGYTLAVLSILGTAKVAVALLVLGVPIIDAFWIIVRRLAQGRSPFSPGSRPPPPPAARPRPVPHPDGRADLRDHGRAGDPGVPALRGRPGLCVPGGLRRLRRRPVPADRPELGAGGPRGPFLRRR